MIPFAHRALLILICSSAALDVLCLLVSAGLNNTPYDTRDSAGRPIGFNDPISAEHLGIVIRNVRPSALAGLEAIYPAFQLLMSAVAGWFIASPVRCHRRSTRWFLLAQVALFPLGVIGWIQMPYFVRRIVTATLDREDFIDGFAGLIPAQSFWVAVALTAFFVLGGVAGRRESSPHLLRSRDHHHG